MAASNGNCFICGKTAGKIAIKNHVLKEHNNGGEMCYLLRAEGEYDKDYWLLFTVSLDAYLSDIDEFLRRIWCECCEHMSAFSTKSHGFYEDMEVPISQFGVGDTISYEYDFGSTTKIFIKIISKIERTSQKKEVRLLARNVPSQEKCYECGAPATQINGWENDFFCDECAEKAGDDIVFSPIVNSPRCGECGYCGHLDIWTFDPNKPFPQS